MFIYIDDILMTSRNMDEHIRNLKFFADTYHKEGLVLS